MDTLKLEAGMYGEALTQGKTLSTWLEDYIVEKGFAPTPYLGMGNRERMAYKKMLAAQGKEIAPDGSHRPRVRHPGFGSVTDSVGVLPERRLRCAFPASAAPSRLRFRLRWPTADHGRHPTLSSSRNYLEEGEDDRQLSRPAAMTWHPDENRGAKMSTQKFRVVPPGITAISKHPLACTL